jgi:hypothetical protein
MFFREHFYQDRYHWLTSPAIILNCYFCKVALLYHEGACTVSARCAKKIAQVHLISSLFYVQNKPRRWGSGSVRRCMYHCREHPFACLPSLYFRHTCRKTSVVVKEDGSTVCFGKELVTVAGNREEKC